ncbi:MAG TPA: YtxH domain-containing protein [Polyangia bacterium]|jgi:hypothetical protein|nr:YtxH domain-containing protein [Polyangia bacterium]
MKLSDVSDLSKNDILAALGLAVKPSATQKVASSIGLIGLGAVIGAGVALLLAPSSGEDLRSDLTQRIRRYTPESPLTDRNGRESESRQAT